MMRMSRTGIFCGLLWLLLGFGPICSAQDYAPRLDAALEKLKKYFADKKPEWKHRSIEPMKPSSNVSVNNWEAEGRIIRISIMALGSEAEAANSMRSFAAGQRTLDRLPNLGDGGYSWGMGGSNICFRKGDLTIWVSSAVTNLRQAVSLSQDFADLTDEAFSAQQPEETPTCARAEFQVFQQLLGNWQVQWTNRITPGKYEETRATAKIETDPLGCVLIEHFAGERSGRPFRSVILLGFGNAEGPQRMLIDSEHGQFLLFNGSKDKDTFSFAWQREVGKRLLMLKHEYSAFHADSFVTETFLSSDSGKTWQVVQRAKYARQP